MKLLKLVPADTNIKFLKVRLPFFLVSMLLIVASWALVIFQGLNYGVDFAGGQEVRLTSNRESRHRSPNCAALLKGSNTAPLWCRNSARPMLFRSGFLCPKVWKTGLARQPKSATK